MKYNLTSSPQQNTETFSVLWGFKYDWDNFHIGIVDETSNMKIVAEFLKAKGTLQGYNPQFLLVGIKRGPDRAIVRCWQCGIENEIPANISKRLNRGTGTPYGAQSDAAFASSPPETRFTTFIGVTTKYCQSCGWPVAWNNVVTQ